MPLSILIINPNSTSSMTDGLKSLVDSLEFSNTQYTYFTAPSGPKSINNEEDAYESLSHCLPALQPILSKHDAFLIACYSEHPLVRELKKLSHAPVTGIFEASVTASLELIPRHTTFGIVSTGKVWEKTLTDAVHNLLGVSTTSSRFSGVETTGLNATELHDAPIEEVRRKMKEATKRLVSKGDVGAICLGCAGMAGMDEMVREACVEEIGKVKGEEVRIVDGVKAGVGVLEALVRAKF
ncbi:MAG: hypothetical protein M1812_007847 [Candelaria pacifica]|nr:MAG: hypothetical protein M1812_007847 [Candelaria pacifica]